MLHKVAVVVATLALVSAVPASAQNRKFVVGEAALGWVETLQPPEIRCAGGEPTGLPFPMCSEDTKRIMGRNEVQVWAPAYMSDSLQAFQAGTITFVVNCTFNTDYRGPCWGTFVWEVADGGIWEGSWTAPVMDLLTYESKLMMVGFGWGGAIDGMHFKFDGGSAPGDWYVTGTVRIQ